MSLVATRLAAIKPSPTLAVAAKAAQLKSEGKDIIGLGAGEPDFDTPQFIKDAAVEAMNKGLTKYTPAGGTVSPQEGDHRQVQARQRPRLHAEADPRLLRRQAHVVQPVPGAPEPGRRGDHPGALLGELPGHGRGRGGEAGVHQRGHRAGLQDHRGAARGGHHAEVAAHLHQQPVEPLGRRLHARGAEGAGRGAEEAPAHRHRERRHVRADPARRLEVREHPRTPARTSTTAPSSRTASPRPTR